MNVSPLSLNVSPRTNSLSPNVSQKYVMFASRAPDIGEPLQVVFAKALQLFPMRRDDGIELFIVPTIMHPA